jgi:hypothetical protein
MTLLRGMKGVNFQDDLFEKTYEAFESFFILIVLHIVFSRR